MADIIGKKISELPETTDLDGLYTVGSDRNTNSRKVSLGFLKEAANYANAQGDYAKGVGDTVAGNVGATDYPVFSASGIYKIGDVVRFGDRLYRFTAPHQSGSWNGADVELTSVNEEAQRKVSELKEETDQKLTELESYINNVSESFPTEGSDGGKIYTPTGARAKIPVSQRKKGSILSYQTIDGLIVEVYTGDVFDGDNWIYTNGNWSPLLNGSVININFLAKQNTSFANAGAARYRVPEINKANPQGLCICYLLEEGWRIELFVGETFSTLDRDWVVLVEGSQLNLKEVTDDNSGIISPAQYSQFKDFPFSKPILISELRLSAGSKYTTKNFSELQDDTSALVNVSTDVYLRFYKDNLYSEYVEYKDIKKESPTVITVPANYTILFVGLEEPADNDITIDISIVSNSAYLDILKNEQKIMDIDAIISMNKEDEDVFSIIDDTGRKPLSIGENNILQTRDIAASDMMIENIMSSNNSIRYKTSGQKLIGAIYWGGASGKASFTQSDNDAFEWAKEQGHIIDADGYEDWREYVNDKYGEYPPIHTSFFMYFYDLSLIYAKENEIEPSINRKPMYGWRVDTKEDVEKEIELASKYGLDYFFMFVYMDNTIFDENNEVKEDAWFNLRGNNGFKQFYASSNKWKMKYCLCLSITISDEHKVYNYIKWISDKFFNDFSYLYMNGSPVLAFYSCSLEGGCIPCNFRQHGMKVIAGENLKSPLQDGVFWYSGAKELAFKQSGEGGIYPYDILDKSNDFLSMAYTQKDEIIFIPVIAGWDPWVRRNYISRYKENGELNNPNKNDYNRFAIPSYKEFYNTLIAAIDKTDKNEKDRAILIYAWNEHAEGGWLVPTYGETTTEQNDFPVIYNGEHQADNSGVPLYFDLSKLEAIREAKTYFNTL